MYSKPNLNPAWVVVIRWHYLNLCIGKPVLKQTYPLILLFLWMLSLVRSCSQQQGGAVFLEPAAPRLVLRKYPQHMGVKGRRVVHFLPMAQLMDHHAVDDLRRRQHQEAVEAEIPFAGTAAPPGLLAADGDRAIVHPHLGSVVLHPLRYVLAGTLRQLFQLHLGQGGKLRCLPLLPLQLLPVLPDPLPVLLHKIFDLPVCSPERCPDNQPLRPQFQPQSLPPAADQLIRNFFHLVFPLSAPMTVFHLLAAVFFHDHSAKTEICK